MRNREYDRFGPWILEVTADDPPPALFLPLLPKDPTPVLAIKIPRPEDRCDLKPGMNLYDAMLVMYEDDILILRRVVKNRVEGVIQSRFNYETIHALRHTEDLLDGSLHIYTHDHRFDIPYSTVSSDLMEQVIDLIRRGYNRAAAEVGSPFPEYRNIPEPDMSMSFLFSGMLDYAKKNDPELKVLAVQNEVSLNDLEPASFRRFYHGIIGKRLLESIHFTDGRELKIVDRGKIWGYRWQAIYGRETTYIPLARIIEVEGEASVVFQGVKNLGLFTDSSRHVYSFVENNSWLPQYEKYLQREHGA